MTKEQILADITERWTAEAEKTGRDKNDPVFYGMWLQSEYISLAEKIATINSFVESDLKYLQNDSFNISNALESIKAVIKQ